jgi:putative NADH-flavin reductase
MAKKIAIIGATGMSGRKLVAEGVARGHEVTALVRNVEKAKTLFGDTVKYQKCDALSVNENELKDFDVVINAFSNHTRPLENLQVTVRLIEIFEHLPNVRFIQILGASSLKLRDGRFMLTLIDTEENVSWIAEPKYGVASLYALEASKANWTGVNPQAEYYDAEASEYVITPGEFTHASDNKSHVSSGNMAQGIMDEIENEKFIHARFSVSDK